MGTVTEGTSRNVDDQLQGSLMPTYKMLVVFLENVVQTKLLTDTDFSLTSIDDILPSLTDHWSDWIKYLIGFTVCAAIGLVLFVVWLFALFIFPCCRCCGNCGGSSKKIRKQKSKCCSVGCTVALLLITVGLLLGALSLFGVNQQLNQQLDQEVFTDVGKGLEGVRNYLKSSVVEIGTAISDGFDRTARDLFAVLDAIPTNALVAIDNATGVVKLLTELDGFSKNLPTLQANLTDSMNLANSLQAQTVLFSSSLQNLQNSLQPSICNSSNCVTVFQDLASANVSVNFTTAAVGLAIASTAINVTMDNGFPGLITEAVGQVDTISRNINSTMFQPVQDMKLSSLNGKQDILKLVDDLGKMVDDIDIAGLEKTVTDLPSDSLYQTIVPILYWVIVGLASVISAIVVFNLLGLLCGLVLRPSHVTDGCCGFNKSLGGHFLMISVSFTFIFYWLFTLIVLLLFVAGGAIHTEFCRHVVNAGDQRSFAVLEKFDNLIGGILSTDTIDIRPFEIYHNCYNNDSLFNALSADKFWNISVNIAKATDTILSSVDNIKQTDITTPKVNLTNPTLLTALSNLGSVFGPGGGVDFTALRQSISGDVTQSLLPGLINRLQGLTASDTTDMNSIRGLISNLTAMNSTYYVPIANGRQELLNQMSYEEQAFKSPSFTGAGATLSSSEATINANASLIVSGYINRTAETIAFLVLRFAKETASSVENDLARCGPLYDSVSLLFDAACIHALYPVNGLWFSLGWCIGLFIPHIFLAVHLTTIFRFRHGQGIGNGNGVGHMDDDIFTTGSEGKEMTSSQRELKAIFYNDLRQKQGNRASKL